MKKIIVLLSLLFTLVISGSWMALGTYAENEENAVRSPVSESEWIEMLVSDNPYIMTNTFTRNGINYKVVTTVGKYSLNEANVIYNLNNEREYTYTFNYGSGTTSEFYYLEGDTYFPISYDKVYYRYGQLDGNNYVQKKIVDNYKKIELIITTTVTDNGEIRHTYNVTNIGDVAIENTSFIIELDTELNGEDDIDLYANGNNGIYMSIEDLTLYVEPVEGITKLFAGEWALNYYDEIDEEEYTTSGFGKNSGELLATNVDTAVYMGQDVVRLEAGESVSFTYQERIVTSNEERPIPNYTVRIQHINQEGVILNEEFITGSEGQTYTVNPNQYEGYELYNVVGETTGIYSQDGVQIIFNYGIPRPEHTITVKHIAEDGTVLFEESLTGKEGTSYTVAAKEFEGYVFESVVGETTGVYGEDDVEIVFNYTVEEKIATPTPTTPTNPITGDDTTIVPILIVFGISVVGVIIIFIVKKRKKN